MKNIRKYMMAAACMTAAAALVACTEAVKRDTEEEIQEMTVPKKPGPITKVPATLTCNGGEEFTFSVSKVQWAETYEWTIAEQEKSKISIIDGQGTNVITVRVVNDDVVIPAQSVSVVAKNELGASKVREYFAAITVSVPIELPGYTIKKYGKRWWMTENCHEAGEDGSVLAGALLAAQPEGVVVGIRQRGVPLYLLRRRDDAARAAGGHAEAAVGAGVPVFNEVGAGEDGIAVGADVLAGRAGGAVGVEIPALTADDLGVGGLHQGVHCITGKQTHSGITPFRGHRSRW